MTQSIKRQLSPRWRLLGLVLMLAWGFAATLLPLSSATAAAEKENITLNFVNADIQSVIKAVGMMTGKNFILDPRVTGTVNIISVNPVSRDLVYPILLSALRLQGYAAVEEKGFVKIVPEADAKLNFSATTDKNIIASGDKIITQVYPLQYESAAQLMPILRPLIAPNNVIAAYPNSNTLVITDYAENIKRINKIIGAIDVPSGGELHTFKLKYAAATDVAQLLIRMMPEATPVQGTTAKLVIATDARANSLIIRSENPATLTRIRALLKDMDNPAAADGGNIHVVYLRNAEATKLADVLRGLMAGDASSKSGGGVTVATAATTPPNLPGAPAASTTASSAPASNIQAYAATNSLIITAPDHVYQGLRSVIDKLDARRAQVFVEALVVEVSGKTAGEFGIQWQDLSGINGTTTQTIGGTNFGAGGNNIIGAATNISSVGQGLNIGIVKGTMTLPGVTGSVVNLGFLARALESDGKTNILSTPNLLTLDNEEAKIVVGQNVPFITGSYAQSTGTGAGVNPFQTIERKDVGLTLRVKPQVAEGGSVKMTIFQEVSSVDKTSAATAGGVTTNKRSIDSTVLVDDGQIIVLGGLVQDDVQITQDKVPLLGDIPLFGNLFKYESRARVKTNLMVFLRPVVLRDSQAGISLTGDRYEYIRNEQGRTQTDFHPLLPTIKAPQLPALPQNDGKALPLSGAPPADVPAKPEQ